MAVLKVQGGGGGSLVKHCTSMPNSCTSQYKLYNSLIDVVSKKRTTRDHRFYTPFVECAAMLRECTVVLLRFRYRDENDLEQKVQM